MRKKRSWIQFVVVIEHLTQTANKESQRRHPPAGLAGWPGPILKFVFGIRCGTRGRFADRRRAGRIKYYMSSESTVALSSLFPYSFISC